MVNIATFEVISAGDAVLAEPVSNNFTKVETAINSNALNSANYGESSILSQNVSESQIVSQHLTDGAVGRAKIADNAINHAKMAFASTDGGVRVLQIGSSPPANGVIAARLTQQVTRSTAVSFSVEHLFSNCIEGDPSFTATPTLMGAPVWQNTASTDAGPVAQYLANINTQSAIMIYVFESSAAATGTVHFVVHGDATSA